METLRGQLNAECSHKMREETMDRFLGLMTPVEFKRNKEIIAYGGLDGNIYVVKSGIARVAYFDGFKEMTFGFGLPGTLLISYYPFTRGEPSFCKFEACCDTTVMKIAKARFLHLLRQSQDFAEWMVFMSMEQLLFHEMKLRVVNGDAKERFESLIENRPEIIANVSARVIASYIGITESYLSTLKKQFSEKSRK
ncbi:MAG: cyclic nucleotide-binding domain-containing protein [Alistipes sp.]|jgi:CRP-like cAMP-binding protein|nr:cyclic nucleotide-binding domain-containing protein [Alistipes sp.]